MQASSLLNSNQVAAEERQLIDKDIMSYSSAILTLKSRRNRLAPISSLPPEIFCRIFSLVKAHVSNSYNFGHRLSWIRVSHVSTHWRAMAINSPSLWSELPIENPRWLAEMLQRSKMAGLTITANFEYYSASKATIIRKILQQHGSRFKHLSLVNLKSESQKLLQDLPLSAPRLETLHITGSSAYPHALNISIPDGVLTGTTKLRCLDLSNCEVHWHSFVLYNITHLKLSSIRTSTKPTTPHFLDVLETMTKLESLIISGIVHVNEGNASASNPIHFNRLHHFSITSTAAEIDTFFRCISFPGSATVQVQVSDSKEAKMGVSAVLSSIAQVYSNNSPDLKFRTLSQESTETNRLCLTLFEDSIEEDAMFVDRVPKLSLTFNININDDNVIRNFFNCGLALDQISHVHLYRSAAKPETFEHTIGMLPILSSVSADEPSCESLITALCPHYSMLDTDSTPLYFKNLMSLRLQAAFFPQYDKPASPNAIDLDLLQDCLIQRYECGLEIDKVVLENCLNLSEEDVSTLSEIVVDVRWDGFEMDYEDSDEDEEEDSEESGFWGSDDYYGW